MTCERAGYGTRIQARGRECTSFDTLLGFEMVSRRFTILPGSRWRLESVHTMRERDAFTRWPWPTGITSSKLELQRRCPSSVASRRWRRSEGRHGAAEDNGWDTARLSGGRICCSHCLAWRTAWLRRRWAQERMTRAECLTSRARDTRAYVLMPTMYPGANYVVRVLRSKREWPSRACRRTNVNSTSDACCGPQWSDRAQHADGRQALKTPRTSATTRPSSRTTLSLSLSLYHDNFGPRCSDWSWSVRLRTVPGYVTATVPLGGWRLHMSER